MTRIARSSVAVATSPGYSTREMSDSMRALLDALSPGLPSLIRPGDIVLVKPFLTQMGRSDPSSRLTSHPVFVRAVMAAVKDCGARVAVGDVGLQAKGATTPPHKQWLYELASEMGGSLVSFAKAGARRARSNFAYPRHYYLTNAVFDADCVVNCANCFPQDGQLLTGAVKNLFNSVIGFCQDGLYERFPEARELAKRIVDVYRLVRPTISFLDMTTVREPGRHGKIRNVGVIIAGQDAVAIDSLAARVLGYGDQTLWTSEIAHAQGLGCADPSRIDVRGAGLNLGGLRDFPLPWLNTAAKPLPMPKKLLHAVNVSLLSPKPTVIIQSCTGCGDCAAICPTGAVKRSADHRFEISPTRCVNCGYCMTVCTSHAIHKRPTGLAAIWNSAKMGTRLGLGPVQVTVRVGKNERVSKRGLGPVKEKAAHLRFPSQEMPHNVAESRDVESLNDGLQQGGVALVVGAGPGLGSALARRFAAAGMRVALAARHTEKLADLIQDLSRSGAKVHAYGCDATDEGSVVDLFRAVSNDHGFPTLTVYNVEAFIPGTVLDIEVPAFEECWRAMCLGGFIVGRESARYMVGRRTGTIVFTGATASLRGRDEYINLAIGKFGVRALAQAMARELGRQGIHVAHVVIDGGILSPRSPRDAREHMSSVFPEHIAETIYHLHCQHPSAWTQELDLRPWVEKF